MMRYLLDLRSAQFLDEGVLWLIIPASVICILAIILRTSQWSSWILRWLVLVLVIVALADPVRREESSSEEIAALFDLSGSITSTAQEAMRAELAEIAQRLPGVTVNLIPFGKEPLREHFEIHSVEELPDAIAEAKGQINPDETNLGAAITSAVLRSEGASILLFSDGFETAGDSRQAAKGAASRGARIYPVIPDQAPFLQTGLDVSSLWAPVTIGAGDVAEIRTAVRNTSSEAKRGKLEVYYDEKKIYSDSLSVPADEERLTVVKSPPNEGGLHRLRAVITADGKENEIHRWISVKAKARLLLVSGTSEDRRVLRQLLGLKGYSVEDIVADGNQQLPKSFEDYSGIIMNNVAAKQLTKSFIDGVKTFAERGGGVLLVGGDKSFGLGGYIDTPIEEISPLKFVPPQTTKRRLNKAVALVIDKSRSMAFDNKIDGAREAANVSIRAMKDEDYVTVIGFDATAFVVIRMDKVSEVRNIASRRLQNLTAMGKTDLLPALVEARRALEKAPADRKHIIVLSDGKVPLAGEEYIQEISRLRQSGISVSGVALGEDADAPFMQMIAQHGKGAFYYSIDASKLPEIFLHDIKVTTGEKTINEGKSEYPVGVGPSGVLSTSVNRYPPIKGYVETLPKRGAQIELVTRGDERVSPLLASWEFGKGKVVAFTSDVNGRWSNPWLSWAEFPKFWTQIIEGIEHAPDEKAGQLDFDLRYSVSRRSLRFDLAVFDEKLQTDASPRIVGEVSLPGGETRTVGFSAEKKGRFVATVENARAGDYKLNISYGQTKFPPLALTVPADVFGEIAGKGLNIQALSELAFISGGVMNPTPAQIVSARRVSEHFERLYVPLVILAFALLLLEVFVREIGIGFILRTLPRKQLFRSTKVNARRRVRA